MADIRLLSSMEKEMTDKKEDVKEEKVSLSREERALQKEAKDSLPPAKRALVGHTDRGYQVGLVSDGDQRPTENYVGIVGLIERVEQLEEDGYVVFYTTPTEDIPLRRPEAK